MDKHLLQPVHVTEIKLVMKNIITLHSKDTMNSITEKERDTSPRDKNSRHTATRAVTILDISQSYSDIFKYLSLNDLLSLSYTCTHLNAEIESRKIKEILFCRNIDPNEKLSSLTQECYNTSIKKWLEGFKNNTVSYLSELTSHHSFAKILFFNISKTLQLCEAFSLKTIATVPSRSFFLHSSLLKSSSRFSPDGRYFASSNNLKVIIMKRTAAQEWQKEDEVNIFSLIKDVIFIPGGQNSILLTTMIYRERAYCLNILEKKKEEDKWEIAYTFKHRDSISNIACSADGRFIASASHDRTTQMIGRIQDRNPQQSTSKQASAMVQAQACDPNQLVTRTNTSKRSKWEEKFTIKHDSSGRVACFNAGVKHQFITVSMGEGKVKIWETDDNTKWKEACILKKGTNHKFDVVFNCAFSRCGRYLYIRGMSNGPKSYLNRIEILGKNGDGIWMKATTIKHKESIEIWGFSPNGQHFLTSSADNTVKVWGINDCNSWEEKYTFQYESKLVAGTFDISTFSPHSRRAAIIVKDKLIILRLERYRVTEEINIFLSDAMLHTDGSVEDNPGISASRGSEGASNTETTLSPYMVAFSADEKHLAIAGNHELNILGFNYMSKVWMNKVTYSLSGHTNTPTSISFSPDCSILAVTKGPDIVTSTEVEMLAISDKEASIQEGK